MPWPLPAPGDIAARAAGVYEAEFARIYALRNPTKPPAVVDARSPNSTLAVHGRVIELSDWDIYLYQARLAQELMPDTAQDWLARHAAIWSVPRDQPTAAGGNVLVVGANNLEIPGLQTLSAPSGALYTSTAAGTLSNTGTGSLAVTANLPGSAGDLPAGTVLEFVVPVPGLNPQTATVDSNGITGGQDLETIDSWRARILARIRQRGAGGSASDYIQWTGEVLQNALVRPTQLSLGNVNVFLAMKQAPVNGVPQPPRVPTTEELAVLTAYLTDANLRKPLGMSVFVTAFALVPVDVTLAMTPNTVPVQDAATAALQLYFASNPAILAADGVSWVLAMSNLDAALSNASGAGATTISLPSLTRKRATPGMFKR